MTTTRTHRHATAWAPASRPGVWAVALAALAVVGTGALAIGFASGGLESADGFSDNWPLTIAGFALLAAAATSVGAGAFALARRHERSWLVAGATALGALVSALTLQQVAEALGWLGS
jgi:hypothetical protein